MSASSGKGAKNKGASYELKVSKILTKWSGNDRPFYRSPASGAWASQRLGQDAQTGDIVSPQSVNFPFSMELKHHEGVSLDNFVHSTGEVPSFLTQAIGDAIRAKKVPALVTHWNYHPNYMSVPVSDFIVKDLKEKGLPYFITTAQYKDALTDELLTIDLLTFVLEDFLDLYTLDFLVENAQEMFKNWYHLVELGMNARKTGSSKEVTQTDINEILSNL